MGIVKGKNRIDENRSAERFLISNYMPPANIIVYISLSNLLLFMVFIKRKTIEKYKKISFLGQVWGKDIFDSNKTPFLTINKK